MLHRRQAQAAAGEIQRQAGGLGELGIAVGQHAPHVEGERLLEIEHGPHQVANTSTKTYLFSFFALSFTCCHEGSFDQLIPSFEPYTIHDFGSLSSASLAVVHEYPSIVTP